MLAVLSEREDKGGYRSIAITTQPDSGRLRFRLLPLHRVLR